MKAEIQQVLLKGLDARIGAMKQAHASVARPARGWLRAVRTALGLSQSEVAGKIARARQSYEDLEKAEERGAISLKSLERAAGAMDCELVYFLVPREAVSGTFARLAQLQDPDLRHLQATEHSMALENQAVGDLPAKKKKQP